MGFGCTFKVELQLSVWDSNSCSGTDSMDSRVGREGTAKIDLCKGTFLCF